MSSDTYFFIHKQLQVGRSNFNQINTIKKSTPKCVIRSLELGFVSEGEKRTSKVWLECYVESIFLIEQSRNFISLLCLIRYGFEELFIQEVKHWKRGIQIVGALLYQLYTVHHTRNYCMPLFGTN